jgi:hypothetical protein
MGENAVYSVENQNLICYLIHVSFLLGLLFNPEDGGDILLSNRPLIFNGLLGVMSQNLELFMITSNPA